MLRWLTVSIFGQRRDPRWKSVRAEHLEGQPLCQACGRGKDVEVHHIVPFSKAPELELEPSNLITLCASPCHLVHGHFMSWRRWNPTVIRDCERYRMKLLAAKAGENR